MLKFPRRTRRRLGVGAGLLVFGLGLWHLGLPPESRARLSLLFLWARLGNYVRNRTGTRDSWLWEPTRHRLDVGSDVGFLIKTGYGTRHRLPRQLEAFAESGNLLGDEGRDFLVIGDWTTVNETDGRLLGVEVHDAIKMLMESKTEPGSVLHPRFSKYRSMQGAVAAGDEEKARQLGQKHGWELDALKFMVGIEFAYKRLPQKKWYLILDDDSYLVKPSLELLLSHLDPTRPQYIGNAVGDYRTRFAHGGSAVLLSGAAVKALFARPDVVARAYVESLEETMGDRLVATTLQKLGIYLDERYSHYFSGERPEMARIREDRICSPVVSFHGLRAPGAMESVGRRLAGVERPVLWGQLWELFGGGGGGGEARAASELPDELPDELPEETRRRPGDHVGPRDEHTQTWRGVSSEDECRSRCEQRSGGWCLAWTYNGSAGECHGSPWMIVGDGGGDGGGGVSGINWGRVAPRMRRCLQEARSVAAAAMWTGA